VAATGGPLALAALFAPGAVSSLPSIGLVALLAGVAFAVPVALWYRYAQHVTSAGGLFAFVEAAAGRRVALAQGCVWVISYFLYLPYTITYIVYDVLPVVFPGIGPYRPWLEMALPVVIVALALLPVRRALVIVAGLALAQLGVLGVLAVVGTVHVGAGGGGFAVHGPTSALAKGAADVSLLYVCTSLPLFLGGETRGGGPTVRKGLLAGFGLSAIFVLLGVLPWAHAPVNVARAPIPGVALARASWDHPFAIVVGVGVAASIVGVIIAEYFALIRLLHAMSGRPVRQMSVVVGAAFLAASGLSLVNPDASYSELVKPSLVALWVSQLLVFLVYPRFAALQRRLGPAALGLAAGASALMAYGL
jgi:amino acid transporter